jgi:hypothetical protein
MKGLKYINKDLNIHENYTKALKLTPASDSSQNQIAVNVYLYKYTRIFHHGCRKGEWRIDTVCSPLFSYPVMDNTIQNRQVSDRYPQ